AVLPGDLPPAPFPFRDVAAAGPDVAEGHLQRWQADAAGSDRQAGVRKMRPPAKFPVARRSGRPAKFPQLVRKCLQRPSGRVARPLAPAHAPPPAAPCDSRPASSPTAKAATGRSDEQLMKAPTTKYINRAVPWLDGPGWPEPRRHRGRAGGL